MQKALEEEKAKKDSAVETTDTDKSLPLQNNTSDAGGSGGKGKATASESNMMMPKSSTMTLKRDSAVKLASKRLIQNDKYPL